MTVGMPLAPFPITYRELWLPPAINNHATLPTSVEGGHGLTLTGAQGRTTADGVRGNGAVTSNINCGNNAVDNAQVKYWESLRFRPDVNWTAGDGDQYLWGKFNDATHFIRLRLDSATGNLVFEKDEGGVGFALGIASPAGDGIWHAGVWYHALCSISNTVNARFKVNDAGLQTDADNTQTPAAGDLCFLDYDDPGAGTGFVGVIADIFCGDDDLTGAEETDLYKGIPPVGNVVHEYLLDEGRGVTAYDRGSGADNGTLDTSPTWAFGQVQQPVISFDCLNDHTQSSAGVHIKEPVTLAWIGKMKSTYDSLIADHMFFEPFIGGDNLFQFYYLRASNVFRFYAAGNNVGQNIDYATKPSIDDYLIMVGTLSATGIVSLYINGVLIGAATGVGAISATAATVYIGAHFGPAIYDISKPLLIALIDGAFTQQQVRTYSRYLKNVFNLPIVI